MRSEETADRVVLLNERAIYSVLRARFHFGEPMHGGGHGHHRGTLRGPSKCQKRPGARRRFAGRLNSNKRPHSRLARGVLLIRLQFVNALFPADLDFGRWLRCSLEQG